VNTNTNLSNCGGCNIKCPQGAACNTGVCECPLIPNLPASGVREVVCNGKCYDWFTISGGDHPAWVRWRAAHPGEPWAICPEGDNFQCNTQAGIETVEGGCCPPGYTRRGEDGKCALPT
jgi:hypothetical protein